MENKNTNIPKIFKFNEAYVAPTAKINSNRNLVEWGKKNDYPEFLMEMYKTKGSPTHKNIIDKKVKLTTGQGLEDVVDNDLKTFIKENKLNKELRKINLDYEIFNGFAFEVIYDNLGENITSLKHIGFDKVRYGVETEDLKEDYFWVCDNWKEYRKEMYAPKYIKAFDNTKQGRQLYYYTEYCPGFDGFYPTPEYSNTIHWIELDYKIGEFHLNQAVQGYAPSFILNIANGVPSVDEQDEFFKAFKRNFAGTENAGNAMITYSDGKANKPEIMPFNLNDSDDRFIMLMEQIETKIVMGAQIPPQLVILTPGKLGSTEERMELLKEFQMGHISPAQNIIEESLNEVLTFDEDVKLKKYEE